MSRRVCFGSLLLTAVLLGIGCGGTPNDGATPPSDELHPSDELQESTPADDATTQALVSLVGVTDDGAVVFTRSAGLGSLEALDPASGATTVLATPFAPADRVMVVGKVVAFWTTGAGGPGSELSVWTARRGVERAAGAASAGVFAATADGERMAWLRTASEGGASELVVGSPSAPVAVVTGVAGGAGTGECAVALEFVNDRLFTATCGPGDVAPTIRTVSDDDQVSTLLAGAKNLWSTDQGGTTVFLVSSDGDAIVRKVSGERPAVTIDRDVTWGKMAPGGDTVIYRTGATALRQASLQKPVPPVDIVHTGVRSVPALAPDFSFALSSSVPDDAVARDLALFPLRMELMADPPMIPTPTLPGLAETLVDTPTAEALGFVDEALSFVAGRHAVFVSDLTSAGLGTLRVHKCATDASRSTDVVLAEGALTPKLVPQSALVAFAHQPRFEGGRLVAVDLQAVNVLSKSTLSLAQGVDPEFSVGRGLVAYTVNHESVLTVPLP